MPRHIAQLPLPAAEPCLALLRSLSCHGMPAWLIRQTLSSSPLAACRTHSPYLQVEGLGDLSVHVINEQPQESFAASLIHSLKDKR